MADGLDTGIPPWLQRNWAPRETFDPTPWLQERYRRQVQAQTLPLQIQGMALQNQAQSLAIEHQGMLNDVQGMQLQQYQSEAPRLQELIKQYATDPVGMMNHVESFQSPVVQKQWQDAQIQAAHTQIGSAVGQQAVEMWKTAARLQATPGVPPIEIDQKTGLPSQDWLGRASQAEEAAQIRINTAKNLWHEQNTLEGKAAAIEQARQGYQNALATGDKAAIDAAKARYENIQSMAMPANETITTTIDPKTGQPVTTFTRGGKIGGGDVTQAVMTDAEKRLGASQRTLENLQSAREKITPGTVGIPGVLNENWEWIANTLNPGSAPTTTTDARNTFRTATRNVMMALKTDSHISTYEQKALKEVADIADIKESAPTAAQKFNTLQDLVALQSVLDSHRINRPAPDWALRSMSAQQANRAFTRGDLTPQEVRQWGQLTGFKP